MKTLIAICSLAASTAALAQSPTSTPAPTPTQSPGKAASQDKARSEADEARTRQQLEEARQRLDQAAREVAELSGKLGARARHDIHIIEGGPRRAVLGIRIEDDPGKAGARVLSVSPGGPAAEAGLRDKDIIIAIDGEPLPDSQADRALVTRMRDVKPDQKVKVRVLRDGKKKDYVVVARPSSALERRLDIAMPMVLPLDMPGELPGGGPRVQHFRFWPGEFAGLELASITPKLGAYFGVTEGVLVVSAPKETAFKLEDGDVIQSIDGRKPDDGPHALRILRSYQAGEKLNLTVLRQRKSVNLAVTMPERSSRGDVLFRSAEPMAMPVPLPPPPPAAPPAPGVRSLPEGPATLE